MQLAAYLIVLVSFKVNGIISRAAGSVHRHAEISRFEAESCLASMHHAHNSAIAQRQGWSGA